MAVNIWSMHRRWALALVLLLGTVTAWAGTVTERLQVDGAVKTPLMLGVDDLKAFPAEQLASLTVTRRGSDGKDASSTVRGVRLRAVLERAGIVAQDHNDWKHMVVLASASDGYRVAFSWPELANTEVGQDVLVVFERDGRALGDDEGRIALVSGRDLNSGPRHVKWLGRIELRLL